MPICFKSAILMAFFCFIAVAEEPSTAVGFVAEPAPEFQLRLAAGHWEPVKQYQMLYEGSAVRCNSENKDEDAVLHFNYLQANGEKKTATVRCADHRDKPWTPPPLNAKPSPNRLVLAVQILLGARPDFYGLTLSRGANELVDAVGAVSAGKLDVGAALAELPHGTYFLQLCRVEPDSDPCAGPLNPLQVEWAGGSAFVAVPPEQGDAALYRVRRFRRERRWRAESDEAWLLTGAAAEQWAAQFEEFKEASQPLAESYGPGGLRALRRAYLHRLAVEPAGGDQ